MFWKKIILAELFQGNSVVIVLIAILFNGKVRLKNCIWVKMDDLLLATLQNLAVTLVFSATGDFM